MKRVVSEMGGKNCVIVDADADLDEAVPAIASSAFGYAGQKCSAAARVLAHEDSRTACSSGSWAPPRRSSSGRRRTSAPTSRP